MCLQQLCSRITGGAGSLADLLQHEQDIRLMMHELEVQYPAVDKKSKITELTGSAVHECFGVKRSMFACRRLLPLAVLYRRK